MRTGRVAHACAVTSLGGRHALVVSGGQNGGEFLSSVEALALGGGEVSCDWPGPGHVTPSSPLIGRQAGGWVPLPALLQPRRNHALTLLGGALAVVSGDTAV